MLNRRILRIKAFKTLYAYAENPSMSLKEAGNLLEESCQAVRDLYLFMLALISPLTAEAEARISAAKNKFNPTEEEKNPNLKFVQNGIATILDEDPDFQKIISRKKLSWEQYDVFLRKLYESVRSKQYFKDYMENPERSLKQDARLFVSIFEEELVDNADLEAILEELSILWNDDLAYALTYCCRSVESIAEGKPWTLPDLYGGERDFVFDLVRNAYCSFDTYNHIIAEAVPGWDKDRLFIIDVVLIITGVAESANFKDIPDKVTINEYVEISKYYSTPKSRSFVNGLLDKLIKEIRNN